MSKQERMQYTPPKEKSHQYEYTEQDAEKQQEQARKTQEAQDLGRTALGDIDDILEEIDSVLETEAVAINFKQQPGQ